MRLCDIVNISYFLLFMNTDFKKQGNKEKETDLNMCLHHAKKGKKMSLTCKAKTI